MNVGRLIDLKLKMINISDLKAETISSAFSNLRYFNSLFQRVSCTVSSEMGKSFRENFSKILPFLFRERKKVS